MIVVQADVNGATTLNVMIVGTGINLRLSASVGNWRETVQTLKQRHDQVMKDLQMIGRRNPVRSITLEQVTKIPQGNTDNWLSVGGRNLPIRVILVGGGGGVTVAVQALLLGGQEAAAPNKIYTQSPVQLVRIVDQEPGAIGFAQLALVRERRMTELQTDRPLEQVLSYVTFGEPSATVRALIEATQKVAGRTM